MPAATLTLTQRLLAPSDDAPYTVRTVTIPATGMQIPQSLIEQFQLPPERVEAAQRRAESAQQTGTWLTPRDWQGAVVLLIPGTGDNRHAFKYQLFRKLLDRGLAVLSVDPPGHGDFMAAPCSLDNTRRAAQNWSDWLHAQPGVRRVGVAGVSFGGNQAADLAARDERIAALATISTPVALPLVKRSTFVREAALLVLPRNVSLLRQQSLRKMWAEWKSMQGAWFAESLYDIITRYDTAEAVRRVGPRPTAFVHGARDVAVPPANARQLFEAAVPDKELILAPQGTHLSVVLYDKEVTRLTDWLAAKLVIS
jgi:pimeloyl-ACP methyl ester carboxylesterase